MASIIRLDPLQNIRNVGWSGDTATNTASDPVSEPPSEPVSEGPYPYYGIIQVVATSESNVMERGFSQGQLLLFGLHQFGLSVVPVADLMVRVELDRTLINGWSNRDDENPGFYLVMSNSPIQWPEYTGVGNPPVQSPGAFVPFSGETSQWEYNYHQTYTGNDLSGPVFPGYRWYPKHLDQIPPEWHDQFANWEVPT